MTWRYSGSEQLDDNYQYDNFDNDYLEQSEADKYDEFRDDNMED